MSQELMYTSVPRGLRPGSSGFCTAAKTAGMSGALEEKLELLSGYRALYPAGHREESKNPIAYAHWRVTAGKAYSILSRVCFAGLDYTRRPSKFAHHLVLDVAEQVEAGPAWVLMREGVMEERWSGEPVEIERGREIPDGENPARICVEWQRATGDAGWAGVLAEAFVVDGKRPAYVIYPAGMRMLPLIDEAVALLPVDLRWKVTFNTYFTDLPADQRCAWRCAVAGTVAANDAPRFATSGIIIDLTKNLGEAPECAYVELARTGVYAQRELAMVAAAAQTSAAEFNVEPHREEADDYGVVEGPPAPEPAEVATAQDWMPPVEATVIEGRKPRKTKTVGATGAAPWLAAALGSVVAAGGMYAWHLHRTAENRFAYEAQVRDLNERLSAREQELKEEREKVYSAGVDARVIQRELDTLKSAHSVTLAELEMRKKSQEATEGRLEQVKQELARLSSGDSVDVARLRKEKGELETKLKEAIAKAATIKNQEKSGEASAFVPQTGKVIVNDKRASHGFTRASVIKPGEPLELRPPDIQPITWRIAQGEKKDRLIITNIANAQASFEVSMNSGTGEIDCDWSEVRARLKSKKVDAEMKQTNLAGQLQARRDELKQYQQSLSTEKTKPAKRRDDSAIASLNSAITGATQQIEQITKEIGEAKQEAAAKAAAIAAMDSFTDPIAVEVRFAGAKVGTLTITKD
jgi:hypothetical protein